MKSRQSNTTPTSSELAILQILWTNGPSSVKEVHAALDRDKPIVYTTILKTMQVMMERGMLGRTEAGRKHIYHSIVEQEDTQNKLLDTFLNKTFSGSAKDLVMRALGKHTPDEAELNELRNFIDSLDNQKNNISE